MSSRALLAIWKKLIRIFWSLIVLNCVLVALLMIFEEKLVFAPSKFPEGDWQPEGLEYHDVFFETRDGIRIHGWYCPVEDPEYVILFSHGNAGNIAGRAADLAQWQQQLNATILAYDYRGFGKSDGAPTEDGCYEDCRAAYRWLIDEQRVDPKGVLLRGRSLGGAVAMQIATEVPHAALVLENTFSSAVAVGRIRFPWLPVNWIMRNRFESIEKIRDYSQPVFISHGTRDEVVPFDMGVQLFEAANRPKHFQELPEGQHNEPALSIDPNYFEVLRGFLEEHARQRPSVSIVPTR